VTAVRPTPTPGLAERVREARLPSPALRRHIRQAAGVTLVEMAEELGVTNVSVLRWERGDCEPRRDRAIAYRRLLEELQAAVSADGRDR
jgi:DNA-binding XRE family transcriptional regulator